MMRPRAGAGSHTSASRCGSARRSRSCGTCAQARSLTFPGSSGNVTFAAGETALLDLAPAVVDPGATTNPQNIDAKRAPRSLPLLNGTLAQPLAAVLNED